MVFGIDDALLAAGINAAGSIVGGYFAGEKEPEERTQTQTQQQIYTPTKIDKRKERLIDQLLRGVSGRGRFADLYNPSEEAFQKSFVEPSLERYKNQIAPQIRQQYAASGQYGGSAMEDQLLRAGVDLNSMLDEKYAGFQQDAMTRKQNAINSILGFQGPQGTMTSTGTSIGSTPGSSGSFGQAAAGYMSSSGFGDSINDLLKSYTDSQQQRPQQQQQYTTAPSITPPRKGFERPWGEDWGVGDRRWG